MDYKEIEKRIDELNLDGYKHIKNNNWDEFTKLKRWLESKKFHRLGAGAYSSVYKSETENFVVKVNDGFIDKGYLQFVDFCHANKGNTHLPKMGQIKKYDDWYIIFIEKLESADNIFDDADFIAKNIENIALDKSILDLSSFSDEVQKQILDCGNVLKNFFKTSGKKTIDMHGGNIMMRGNTIVITDPVI